MTDRGLKYSRKMELPEGVYHIADVIADVMDALDKLRENNARAGRSSPATGTPPGSDLAPRLGGCLVSEETGRNHDRAQ